MKTEKYQSCRWEFRHSKKTGEVQIKMRDDNGKPFIDMLYNMLLEPDLCN